MAALCDRVRSGEWKGHTGRPIRTVVNLLDSSTNALIRRYRGMR